MHLNLPDAFQSSAATIIFTDVQITLYLDFWCGFHL